MLRKPKRPHSAYMMWLDANREQIKRDNPGITSREVARLGDSLWRDIPDKSVSTKMYELNAYR